MRASKKTDFLRLSGNWGIGSDPHCPCQHDAYIDEMIKICKFHGIENFDIPGDLFDFDTLSRFDDKDQEQTVEGCLEEADGLLDKLNENFPHVVFTMGNHDRRLIRALHNTLTRKYFQRILGEKIEVSYYTYAEISCSGLEVRVAHPKEYSRITGKKPMQMANVFNKHFLGAHGHHLGFYDVARNGKFGLDIGGLFDEERIKYIQMDGDTSHERWRRGFAILKDGKCTLYSERLEPCIWFVEGEIHLTEEEWERTRLSQKIEAVRAAELLSRQIIARATEKKIAKAHADGYLREVSLRKRTEKRLGNIKHPSIKIGL